MCKWRANLNDVKKIKFFTSKRDRCYTLDDANVTARSGLGRGKVIVVVVIKQADKLFLYQVHLHVCIIISKLSTMNIDMLF